MDDYDIGNEEALYSDDVLEANEARCTCTCGCRLVVDVEELERVQIDVSHNLRDVCRGCLEHLTAEVGRD